MSDSVVIKKTLQADLIENHIDLLNRLTEAEDRKNPSYRKAIEKDLEALRAAPETLNLEGVERLDYEPYYNPYAQQDQVRFFSDPNGMYVRFSDLRCLVAPVHLSAVVSVPGVDFGYFIHTLKNYLEHDSSEIGKALLFNTKLIHSLLASRMEPK